MTSKKNYKELENEKTRGKKRYLERVIEEEEADKEINNYQEEHPLFPERTDED